MCTEIQIDIEFEHIVELDFMSVAVEDFIIHDLYTLTAYAEQQSHRERLKQVKL